MSSRSSSNTRASVPALLLTASLLAGAPGACASAGGRGPSGSPGAPPVLPAPAASGRALADTALVYRGIPYRTGGADPSGFDCSGLVQYVLAQHGVVVPRMVEAQAQVGRPVDRSRLTAGDLVFFKLDRRSVSHVGIAIGGGAFVHAPKERGRVRVESLDAPYWARRYVGARRVAGR